MRPSNVFRLLREGVLDPELAALLWLLTEGGAPIVVAGPAAAESRSQLAAGILSIAPSRPWVVLDADDEELDSERLAALLRGGAALGVSLAAVDLETLLSRLADAGLPEDGVRRLGIVVIAEEGATGLRCRVVHYLRPAERDAQGHVQRRPPAVLAAWDAEADAYEHYAWGITPELADRVDRAQADLEERQRERASFLEAAAADDAGREGDAARVERYLASEPPRLPAPEHEAARSSPFSDGLTDPDAHVH